MVVLVPCLVALRAEFNRVSPRRDVASDGWLGDVAHALQSSDHNPDESGTTPYEDVDTIDEVHALDVDDTGPWPSRGWFDQRVEYIRAEHAAGRDSRLQNIIRNGRIASRKWGWRWIEYTGVNRHYQHAHFSARYTTKQENDVSPWGVEPTGGTVTQPTEAQMKAAATAGVLSYAGGGLPGWAEQPENRNFLNSFTELFREVKEQDTDLDATQAAIVAVSSMLASLIQDPADMDNPETHPIIACIRYTDAHPVAVP